MTEPSWPQDRRITVRDLQAATDRGERWAMLTSYDALTAGVFERAGVRALLVGDTAAMVVYGHDSTLPVTMGQLIPLVQPVARGTTTALIVADLPFGAYQGPAERALDNAARHPPAPDAGARPPPALAVTPRRARHRHGDTGKKDIPGDQVE